MGILDKLRGIKFERDANLQGVNLVNHKIKDVNLTNADLSRANLEGAQISGSTLIDANLTDANLMNAKILDSNMGCVKLVNAKMQGVKLKRVGLHQADLTKANLSFSLLEEVNLQEAMLDGINLEKAGINAILKGTSIKHAKLKGSSFSGGYNVFEDANLEGSDMEKCILVGIVFRNTNFKNVNLKNAYFNKCDLSTAILDGTILDGVRIEDTKMPPSKNPKDGIEQDYFEKNNVGTRYDSSEKASSYWMLRLASPKNDPFVLYEFANEQDAKNALLALPCIKIAKDTNRLICTEVLSFGYYQVENGKYESFLCGPDLSNALWEKARNSFIKFNGKKKESGELAPGKGGAAMAGIVLELEKVNLVNEYQKNGNSYHIYRGPNAATAKAFLEKRPVTAKFEYIVVETPEGNYGRDIDGMYKE